MTEWNASLTNITGWRYLQITGHSRARATRKECSSWKIHFTKREISFISPPAFFAVPSTHLPRSTAGLVPLLLAVLVKGRILWPDR